MRMADQRGVRRIRRALVQQGFQPARRAFEEEGFDSGGHRTFLPQRVQRALRQNNFVPKTAELSSFNENIKNTWPLLLTLCTSMSSVVEPGLSCLNPWIPSS